MFADNTTTTNTSVSTPTDFQLRIDAEARRQQDELFAADKEVSPVYRERRASFCSLVNVSRKFHMTADVIDYYHRRYYGTPAVVTYTSADAERDILAAGLPYHVVRPITRDANIANLTGEAYRQHVAREIVAWKRDAEARRERNAATLARISAVQAVR